MNRKVFSLL